MDQSGAEKAITTSALIVIGIYAYRRFTESATATTASVKSIAGVGPPPSVGVFATGWTFAFLACSIMAEVDPGLGGGFAVLIATTDFLVNGNSILTDVTAAESTATKTTTTTTKTNTTTGAQGSTSKPGSSGTALAGVGTDAVTSALTTGLIG